MNIERIQKLFENHKATLTDYSNIKILDFKNPESSEYRIRFLFEEDYCKLHITGDLGELIASNYSNMTFEKFSDFVNNIGYFKEKVDCHSRPFYAFDEEKAKRDLIDFFDDNSISYGDDEAREELIEEIMDCFDEDKGLSDTGINLLSAQTYDDYEAYIFGAKMGRVETDILDIYMLAFKLATEQLNKTE